MELCLGGKRPAKTQGAGVLCHGLFNTNGAKGELLGVVGEGFKITPPGVAINPIKDGVDGHVEPAMG